MKKKVGIVLSLMMSMSLINSDLNIVNAENDNQEITEYSSSVIGSGKCGDNATWSLSDDGSLTISGTGEMYDYNYNQPWKDKSNEIKKVVVQNGITKIGSWAFAYSKNATSFVLPEGVTEIGSNVFSGCQSMTAITLPKSLKKIGSSAFGGCASLKSITLPEGIETILSSTFSECSSLTNVSLPQSLQSIEDGAFSSCTSLEKIVIPDSVIFIKQYAFAYCEQLTDITLSNNITNIDSWTFKGCKNLKKIVIPEGVIRISMNAFEDCTSLSNITLPTTMETIGTSSFFNCTSLKNITLTSKIEKIEGNAFRSTGLTSISIPGNVKTIEHCAFYDCKNLEKVILNEGIETIGYGCFDYTNIKELSIPASVTTIGDNIIEGCTNLENILVNSNNKNYCAADGILYNKQKTEVITCPSSKQTIVLPKTVVTLKIGAFSSCKSLQKINLPNGLKTIETIVFNNCTNLKNITIPKSVTSIDGGSFEGCKNLTLSVYKGSYGEKYAQKYNLKYSIIGSNVLATSIKLNTTSKTLFKGKTYTLVSTIAPTNATNKTATYTTSNKKVATVTSKGTVKAVNYGIAVITAKTSNGKTATCKVTVPYTVKYNLNGGTNNKSNPTSYYGKKITLQNPTRKGYIFAGWYSDSKYKTKVTSFSSGNKVLYAKWSKVTVGKNIVKLANNSINKIKITYSAISKVKGYQIQYGTNSKFTGSKTKTTTSRSYITPALTKGKRYYVRVRGYKIDSTGSKVYGSWSDVKNLVIPKGQFSYYGKQAVSYLKGQGGNNVNGTIYLGNPQTCGVTNGNSVDFILSVTNYGQQNKDYVVGYSSSNLEEDGLGNVDFMKQKFYGLFENGGEVYNHVVRGERNFTVGGRNYSVNSAAMGRTVTVSAKIWRSK